MQVEASARSPAQPAALVPDRSSWAQAGALFGSFGAAIGLGWLVGTIAQPEGQGVLAVVTFAALVVFIGGMALWGSICASIMAAAIFNGDLLKALLRFFFRGRNRSDLPTFEGMRERVIAAAHKVYGWTRVFVWLAIGVALVAAPLAGILCERGGFLAITALTACVLIGFGAALRALARAGYLMPPDLE